ncbi:MAG: hypothetical protein ACOX17_10180 [Christensenellales bacterium]|jgi:ribosomal protein L37AE/L43A
MEKGLAFRRIKGVWVCACGDSLWVLKGGAFRQKIYGVLPETLPLSDITEDLSRHGVKVIFSEDVLWLEPPADWPMPRIQLLLERADTWLRQAGRPARHACIHCGKPGLPRIEEGEAVWLCGSCEAPAAREPVRTSLLFRIWALFRSLFRRR